MLVGVAHCVILCRGVVVVVVAGMFVDVRILDCVGHVIVASATFTKAFAFLRESLVCW